MKKKNGSQKRVEWFSVLGVSAALAACNLTDQQEDFGKAASDQELITLTYIDPAQPDAAAPAVSLPSPPPIVPAIGFPIQEPAQAGNPTPSAASDDQPKEADAGVAPSTDEGHSNVSNPHGGRHRCHKGDPDPQPVDAGESPPPADPEPPAPRAPQPTPAPPTEPADPGPPVIR